MKESACSCQTCQKMCKTCPCIGTPIEIAKIVNAGFKDKVGSTIWMSGMVVGIYHKPVRMVQPLMIEGHGCAFLKEGNLCELHDLGLKPIEGRMATHTNTDTQKTEMKLLLRSIAIKWDELEKELIKDNPDTI